MRKKVYWPLWLSPSWAYMPTVLYLLQAGCLLSPSHSEARVSNLSMREALLRFETVISTK